MHKKHQVSEEDKNTLNDGVEVIEQHNDEKESLENTMVSAAKNLMKSQKLSSGYFGMIW